MSELRPWLRPYVVVADFVSHRGWPFWTAVLAGGFAASVFLSLLPGDRANQQAAERLRDITPTTATEVLWHVVNGELEDVAVVLPGPGEARFTVDLAGIDGPDVEAYDGWQPASEGMGGDGFVAPLRVRVDFATPPVAMRDQDVADYDNPYGVVTDLLLGLLGVGIVVGAIVMSARQDQELAPPSRRRARHA